VPGSALTCCRYSPKDRAAARTAPGLRRLASPSAPGLRPGAGPREGAATVPELDIADAEGTLRGDTILVSVAPPDGVAVAAALREGGFVVTEAPLHLPAVGALAEIPRVMIVDVDVPGAMEAIERAREVAPAELV